MKENIFDKMVRDIRNSDLDNEDMRTVLNNIKNLRKQKINILITGSTGSGKSSTINTMFNTEVAKVGTSVDPKTMNIEKYDLDNLILWDTSGYDIIIDNIPN